MTSSPTKTTLRPQKQLRQLALAHLLKNYTAKLSIHALWCAHPCINPSLRNTQLKDRLT